MDTTNATVPKHAVQGVASGMLFMALFGTMWAGIGIMGLQNWGGIWPACLALLIGAGLVTGGVSLRRSAQRLPDQVAPTDTREEKRIGRWFGIVFAAEGVLIAIASVVCNRINRFDLFFPTMAIIVGIHFLPLAGLFRVRPYYLVGIAFCLLAIITLLVIPQHAVFGGQSINPQLVVLGFGAALTLWVVGAGLWVLGRRLVRG